MAAPPSLRAATLTALLLAACASGVWIALDPAVSGGLLVALPFLGWLGWWFAGWSLESAEDREASRRVFLVALAIRIPTLLFLHASVDPNSLAPDQVQYDRYSALLLDQWQGKSPFPSLAIPATRTFYFGVCAVFYWIFGANPLGPKLLNAVAGSLAAALIYRLARHLGGERRAAWTAGILAGLMPSLVLWSVLQIRDALALFALALLFESYARLQKRMAWGPLLGAAASFWLVTQLRDYLAYPIAIALLGGALAGRRREWSARWSLAALALLVLLVIGTWAGGLSGNMARDLSLEDLDRQRMNLAEGGSAYGIESDISSPTGALLHLPSGLAHFLLGPFPWQTGTYRLVLALPEMFLWYGLLPFVVTGALSLWRRQGLRMFALGSFLGAATFMYALVEGNVGTAFRHRAQLLVFFLYFAGEGISEFRTRRERQRGIAGLATGDAGRSDAGMAEVGEASIAKC